MFIDTPFNKDCPHHKLYFTTKPERCPYCGALSMTEATRRARIGCAIAVLAGGAFAAFLWWRFGWGA